MLSENSIRPILRKIAITGNLVLFCWILYNGYNENFQGTRIEIVSYLVLMLLLLLNTYLLIRNKL